VQGVASSNLVAPTNFNSLRLARFFGTSHQFWLNLQANYDVQCAEYEAGPQIAKIKPYEVIEEAEHA
jgi:plasmid maintenance system antidote protein VapI